MNATWYDDWVGEATWRFYGNPSGTQVMSGTLTETYGGPPGCETRVVVTDTTKGAWWVELLPGGAQTSDALTGAYTRENGDTYNTIETWTYNLSRAVEPPVDPPTAAILGPSSGDEGISVTFDGSGSTPGLGRSIGSYRWETSDGQSATGAVVGLTFDDDGSFLVTLTVCDSLILYLCDDATVAVVISNMAPIVSILTQPGAILRLDTAQAPGGSNTVEALFEVDATDVASDLPLYFDWSFDDGDSDAGTGLSNVSHGYEELGSFVPMVEIADGDGGLASLTFPEHTVQALGRCGRAGDDSIVRANVSSHWGPGSTVAVTGRARFFDGSDSTLSRTRLRSEVGEVLTLVTDSDGLVDSACLRGRRYLGVARADGLPSGPGSLFLPEKDLTLVRP